LAPGQHGDPRHARAGHRRAREPCRAHARRQGRERRHDRTARRAGARMNLRESTGIALGALRANKLRSFLTLLGTIIGVASVIAVISFVEGLNRFVSDKLINAGSNVFVVDKYGFITSNEAYEEARKRPDIRIEDSEALARGVPHARMVVAQTGSTERI